MSKLNGNEPAFPNQEISQEQGILSSKLQLSQSDGFTVRQLLAKDFMCNMLHAETNVTTEKLEDAARALAKSAFVLADAFIEVNNELEK